MGTSPAPSAPPKPDAPRVVAITLVRDEAEMLPRWINYYGGQLGHDNLIVLDDNSVDGSTDDLPCLHYRLPPGPWKAPWSKTRLRLVNGLAQGLLAVNDVVVYSDVDELIVPDPARHAGLRAYLAARPDGTSVAPLAVEVVHHAGSEPPLDPSRGVLEQRGFVKYSPAMCKPLVRWGGGGRWSHSFHASATPFPVDPELWMFHLKFADEGLLRRTARAREHIHRVEGRGHPASFWAMSEDTIAATLARWTAGTTDVPDLDPGELDLADLVQLDDKGTYQATANQVQSLETTPLRRIPERFRSAF
jgi:hypothetical protein